MFHQRRKHTTCFARTFKSSKKSCRVFQFPRQVQSYAKNGKRLKPVRRRWKSTRTFTKTRNNDMNRHCRDIKKIIWMKWWLLTFTKGVIRQTQKQSQRQLQRLLRVNITFFWGSNLMRWQGKIEKTIEILCQEGRRRSKKILQDYPNTMIGQDRWTMKQRNRVMNHKMKKRW